MKDILYIHDNEIHSDHELYDTNYFNGMFTEVHYTAERCEESVEFHGMHTFVYWDLDVTKIVMYYRDNGGNLEKVELPKETYSIFEDFIRKNHAFSSL